MSVEQRESIESEFFTRWVFKDDLYLRWFNDEVDDKYVIESLPVNIDVEKLVGECIGFNALVNLCHSSDDIYYASRARHLINLLIKAELIPLRQGEDMQIKIYRATEDMYLEMGRIDECN